MYAELGFDALLAIGAGIGIFSYMLGIVLEPALSAGVGFALVLVGVVAFVPRDERATASALGLTAVGLAGIVIPRAVTTIADPVLVIGNELVVTLAASGLVLLLSFALVRSTTFRRRPDRTA